ncbi:non-ribosomal peptide synthase/polyketide synthase [Brevibacillus dissolubilis]|uniref:non-ribosomal peptide synthase/polyketide synthase n=1 Tax=Brevibacillus dissolubilis TaxID=1844116 RepID=UPI0011171EEC|nr:non-ribosomal peptide synthase/polyketide synthase [Brevibacillus dissolubilis]
MSIKHPDTMKEDTIEVTQTVTKKEVDIILHRFNDTKADYPKDKTIHQRFEEQAEKTPGHVAVVFENQELTYLELNKRANQLARTLREQGVGPDQLVGIMSERSPEMIVGIFAVLKAGGAYVPIDPNYPEERIRYMLEDSGAPVLLVQKHLQNRATYTGTQIILDDQTFYQEDGSNLEHVADPHHLAYVIYTSGTTGKPKGVMLEHHGIVSLHTYLQNQFSFGEQDRFVQFASFSFDASVWEMMGCLLSGATLYLPTQDTIHDPVAFGTFMQKNKITASLLPPAYVVNLDINHLTSMRVLVTGGSATNQKIVETWKDRVTYVNAYGPTESSILATTWIGRERTDGVLPIGEPVSNTQIYIVDAENQLQPIGTAGELCIAGDGLARGYLNRPDLTAEKFIDNPFVPGEKMYKTGDLARWLPDGNIEYLGRMDDQVKVRGFRIELGEIENQLLKHPVVKDAVVTARKDSEENDYICAYLTFSHPQDDSVLPDIRQFLSTELPDYMIPSYFVTLDQLPLTANGKVDKKALPEPDGSIHTGAEYEAPRNETEQKLAEIWQEVLHVKKVGINDHFSMLGGHSLNAIELIAKMNERLGEHIPLKQLFRLSTIKGLSAYIEAHTEEGLQDKPFAYTTDLEKIHEPFPLTGIQLAYLVGRDPSFEIGGVSTSLTVEFEIDMDLERFNRAFQKLIDRHPILRTIVFENGTQQILEELPVYTIDTTDVTNWSQVEIEACILQQRERLLTKVIDPSQWPLFEIKTLQLPNGNKYFFLNMDALICDDSSLKILIKEFQSFYENIDLQLPDLQFNFRDYVQASAEFRQSNRYKKDEKYWMDKLEKFPGAPALPLKCDPADVEIPQFGKLSQFMDGDNWNQLKQKARKRNVTPTSVLCAAYAYVLAYWSNQDHFGVNLTVFNRIPFHEDVKKLVGDFTTLMVLDIDAKNSLSSFWDFAEKVQDSLLEALEHRHYDGVDFIRHYSRKQGMNKNAAMPIVFTSVLNDNPEDSFDQLVDFNKISFLSTRTSQVYIDNQVYEINGGLYITWDFVDQLFEDEVIQSMFTQYMDILNQVISAEQIADLELGAGSLQVIEKYNDTDMPIPVCPLHQMLVDTAKRLPDHMAVKHHEQTITYRELDERSNQIARYLIEQGVCKGDYIGVIAKRCIDTIVNLYGVLKSGAAYIPLDPEYPEERKEYIKEKANCKFFVAPDLYEKEKLHTYSTDAVDTGVTTDDMAYVIFTSGSTGKPKGVQIKHGAAANTIFDMNEKFAVTEKDRFMGISSMCFDLSVYDVFGAALSGAVMVIVDDQRDVFQLKQLVENERITIWNSVPAIMELTVDLYTETEHNDDLRVVLLSGDWISLKLPEKINRAFRTADVISLGGATEASIWSIYYPINEVSKDWKSIPYGMPLGNQKIYVLNQNQQFCPVGVEGELYIGGVGVASGYINDEEKTNAAFIMHPQLGYIYKTGDHGLLRAEGYVEFLGRKDSQVKIRGYRVELGEIENSLLQHEDVKKAAVIDYTDDKGIKNLLAFVVSAEETDPRDLKQYLQQTLPPYMIPARFFQIDEIPLTVNGKVNKSMLVEFAKVQPLDEVAATTYEEPTDEMQTMLLNIWKEVFQLEHIGTDVSYYEIGGDSLKAIRIVAEVNKKMNIEIPIGEIFKNDTILALDHYLKNRSDAYQENKIKRIAKQDYYPTSPAQNRMYLLSKLENDRGAYHIPMALLVEGNLDVDQLEQALHTFIQRHEILRTGFERIQDELMQKVYDDVEFHLGYEDLGVSVTDADSLKKLTGEACKALTQPFDLTEPPLMRAKVFKLESAKHLLVINFHHIIADGVSQGILMNELLELYSDCMLPEVPIQYKDYVSWNQSYNQSEAIQKQEAYWLDVFRTEPAKLQLPYDYSRRGTGSYEGSNVYVHLGQELSEQIRRVSKETGSTLYMTMLSAYYVLLHKYTNQTDIVVGTAASGRLHQDLQDVFGVFVNTIALRNEIDGANSFAQLLEQVKRNTIAGFENSEYQFDELIRKLDFERVANRNPLFDTMFVLEDGALFSKQKGELQMSPVIFDLDNAKFDITYTVLDMEDEIVLNIEYSTELFHPNTMNRMADSYLHILKEISRNLHLNLHAIEMISEEEKTHLLVDFNDTLADFPQDKTVHQLFEEQVERTPDHVAVVAGNHQLTYRELQERSNQLARVLQENGVKPDTIVGIMMDRSVEMIVGILAIIKSGGAYLPIDPAYPAERIEYMLQDSQTRLLVTRERLAKQAGLLENNSVNIINIDCNHISSKNKENLVHENRPNDLAYVIYTSGSTGKPKGVMVEHRSLVNLCSWHISTYQVTSEDRSASYASMSFDAFGWEVFPYLLSGSAVHVLTEELRLDVEKLNQYFHEHQITITFLPTQVCEQFMKLDNQSLRTLLTGGDKLNYFETKNYQIVNNYGPTENTVVATHFVIDQAYVNIPIGTPLHNTSVYILNEHGALCPIGVAGELCISGVGLARGYLHRPELTAEKFVPNPFVPGTKMYRSGDLARRLSDGTIEYLGRIDYQVKIRGYRIELGEIENQLLQLASVKEAVVVAREDQDQNHYLCAYITLETTETDSTIAAIRQALSNELPEYMIPAYFVMMDQLPLTANGKVDRKALPAPEVGVNTGTAYEAPSNELEEKLVLIWQETLGAANIGVTHNFFEVGGHSLKATTLISKMHKELKVEVPLSQIFKTPTIRGLAAFIGTTQQSAYASIKPAEQKAYYELSSAQRRVYILSEIEGNGTSYNMPFAMRIQGGLDVAQLERAFQALVERHEALRTSFEMVDGEPVQKIHQVADFKLAYSELGEADLDEKQAGWIQPFDLTQAPLLRAEIVKVADQEHILLADMHHIISDGVSMGIIMGELAELYKGNTLAPLHIQYKDYSEWQAERSKQEELKQQEQYWLDVFNEEIPALDLPTDYARPQKRSYQGDIIHFQLDAKTANQLDLLAKEHGVTMYMVLLAAYTALLSKYTGQEDIVVGTPIAGRKHADLNQVLGMFVNTLAIKNKPAGHKTFSQYLNEVKEHTLKAYENQDYPFEQLVEKLNIRRDLSRNPLFDTMLVLNNTDTMRLDIDGLEFTLLEDRRQLSKFDLTVRADETQDGWKLEVEYCTALFTKERMQRFSEHFIQLLQKAAQQPSLRLCDIDMLTEAERNTMLFDFNNTQAPYAKEKTLTELFEEQVEKTPDQIALVFEDTSLTYRELNERANNIAYVLRQKGVGPDVVTGIMVERSLEMIVGVMGILKAGGAYLPIDPEFPEDRKQYMLSDSQAKVLCVASDVATAGIAFDGEIVRLDQIDHTQHPANVERVSRSSDLAYVIYTSGSTGQPKGVMINQYSVHNLVNGLHAVIYRHYTTPLNVALIAPYIFDASVKQIFAAVLLGHALHIVPKATSWDANQLIEYYAKHCIHVSDGTPAHFKMLTYLSNEIKQELAVKEFVIGGDVLTHDLIEEVRHKVPNLTANVTNVYGPTECTVDATSHRVVYGEPKQPGAIPIGKPLMNTNIYIVDKANHLQPLGVAGEMCIGGEGVARGYLCKPELTAEKFVDNPFEPGQKMYRTGDLARWLPDGQVEFIGRVDHQVKIRGYRIELGEIEHQLVKHEQIAEAVVIAKKDNENNDYLCAYIALDGSDQTLTIMDIREFLASQIPDYMIPAHFVKLDRLPRTTSGKVDRKLLPEPDGSMLDGVEYEAPRNEQETKLAQIWQEILGVQQVSINHNFFAIGGDSIKALQIISRLAKAGLKLQMRDLFANPTIRTLSKYVKEEKKDRTANEQVTGEVLLTPIQQRYFERNQEELNHFNHSIMLYREGGFDEQVIQQAFDKLFEHHDALRMIYEEKDGVIVQTNRDQQEHMFDLSIHDLRGVEHIEPTVNELATTLQKDISIKQGKLVKLGLFQTDEGDHLLIVVHHLVIDGVSWRILLEDFENLYTQAAKGEKLDIGYKTDSFQHFAKGLQGYADHHLLQREKAFWQSVAQAQTSFIPKKQEGTRNLFEDSRTITIKLGKESTNRLLRQTNRAYNTEINDILLTALMVSVRAQTGEDRLKIMMEGHGREEIGAGLDLSRTIGWFTSVYPVWIDLAHETELATNIKTVKEILRKTPNKGIGYGVLKYMAADSGLSQEEKAPISFNYLGEMDQDVNRGLFVESKLPTGQTVGGKIARSHSIEMNSIVLDGELVIHTTYNESEYDEQTIHELNRHYVQSLEQIIEHCIQQPMTERTPSDYGDTDITLEQLDAIQKKYATLTIEKIVPLANMQKGMLFHSLERKDSSAYFQQVVMDLHGFVDAAVLEQSFNEIMKRHEGLRAAFEYEIVAEPRQLIIEGRQAGFTYLDWTGKSTDQQAQFTAAYLTEDQEKGFDLSADTLMRVGLIKTQEQSYTLVWSHHHILLDGWCLGIILNEMFAIYTSIIQGKPYQLEDPRPFSDYIRWLEQQNKAEAQRYWTDYLAGYEKQASLPKTGSNASINGADSKEKVIHFSKELTERMTQLANSNRVTFNTVFQSIWGVVLGRYNQADDVVFGTVVSGREADVDGIENMVGLFINTIPTRVRVQSGERFRDVLQNVQNDALQSNAYTYLNLSEVQDLSVLKRELLDHVLVFQNYAIDEVNIMNEGNITGFTLTGIKGNERTNYDFSIVASLQDCLTLKVTYNESVFDPSFIDRLEGHLITVTEQVVTNENVLVQDIEVVSAAERNLLLHTFNDTKTDYPKDKTIAQLFEEQVERTPDHAAVVMDDQVLTYRQLNERSNQLARYLRDKGVQANTVVAIMAERSLHMMIGLMGILKSGAAYLPIDPEWPQERITHMLTDCQVNLFVTQRTFTDAIQMDVETILLDAEDGRSADSYSTENLTPVNSAGDTAYIIYTSGSTGTPKGVVISHTNAIRVVKNTNYITLDEHDHVIQLSNYAFDGSVFDIFGALLNGARLVLMDKETVLDISKLAKLIRTQHVTVMFITTALFNVLVDRELECLSGIRKILFGGERVSVAHAKKALDYMGPDKMLHVYGPTESTVYATYYPINDIKDDAVTIPIGAPLANTTAYVVDQHNRLVPIGVPGELCIAGDGLSSGYLNNPQLTAEKFVPHPFAAGERMYRTGDLVRWLSDGTIEFLERIDHQVKLRGFRIELGEIESSLLKHTDIQEAFVMARKDQDYNDYLCAYITAARELHVEELRSFLGESLPEYMIPAYFVKLDQLPLTPNGKVDRKALPEPDTSIITQAAYEAPTNFVEEQLVSIWAEVLGVERIGTTSHFFELGGNSLKVMHAVHAINKKFQSDISIRSFFEHPTIKQLAAIILGAESTEPSSTDDYVELEI